MNNNDDIKAASFKFNTNLIKLSTSDNIEEAKKEWEFIMKTTEKTNNNICMINSAVFKSLGFVDAVEARGGGWRACPSLPPSPPPSPRPELAM